MGFASKLHLVRVRRILFHVGSCDFVDRLCFPDKSDGPRSHPN